MRVGVGVCVSLPAVLWQVYEAGSRFLPTSTSYHRFDDGEIPYVITVRGSIQEVSSSMHQSHVPHGVDLIASMFWKRALACAWLH